ncbi:MAG: 3-oxosteroid 1-dehydrogenase [Porticoccaceae bacterium]|nr:MAG: 3-oxosteroid 1-dehydrogenase [Porticoccaceae bacterium]
MSAGASFDVVVVGSGAAGATAALRAAERGLSVVILEKSHKFGGTSATSGGVIWVPNHQLSANDDSREQAEAYLGALIRRPVRRERLAAYLDAAPRLAHWLKSLGVPLQVATWPDYYPDLPGARADRSLVCETFDGRLLGDHFLLMREQYSRFKVMNRYAIDLAEFFALSTQAPGWQWVFLKMAARYWADLGTRRLGRRDRRFTQGAALMGHLYWRIFARGVPLWLECALEELVVREGRVAGVVASRFGRRFEVEARRGVVLAAGGFEWNQALRERFLPLPGRIYHSSTPPHQNRGEALLAAEALGAATEHTDSLWWMPTMDLPITAASNFEEIHQAAFDVGRPGSVCVNRNGVRFANEAASYDEFGAAMVADQLANGANAPCWLVFDSRFRRRWTAGGLLPSILMPDWKVPRDWWDHYLFRAPTLAELAAKIGVPGEALERTVANMNEYARTGVDPEFGRGGNAYDRMFGDPAQQPNPCLGPIDRPPFYAVPIQVGDLGTKGGLAVDAAARVLDGEGRPISGLYAAGNCAASPFGDRYPGAGGTIGPAMTFAYLAVDDLAALAR